MIVLAIIPSHHIICEKKRIFGDLVSFSRAREHTSELTELFALIIVKHNRKSICRWIRQHVKVWILWKCDANIYRYSILHYEKMLASKAIQIAFRTKWQQCFYFCVWIQDIFFYDCCFFSFVDFITILWLIEIDCFGRVILICWLSPNSVQRHINLSVWTQFERHMDKYCPYLGKASFRFDKCAPI